MIYFVGPESLDSAYTITSPQYVIEYFKDKDELQVDTETDNLCPHRGNILCLQLGDTENQFVIDVRYVPIALFKDLLEQKLCLLQNAKFDYKILKKQGIVMEHIYDTMLAEIVIFNGYENRDYSLEALVKRYKDIQLNKDVREDFHRIGSGFFTPRMIQYAAEDVMYLQDIRNEQERILSNYDLLYALNVELNAVKAIGDIEYNGMYFNPEKWKALAFKNKQRLRTTEIKFDEFLLSSGKGYVLTEQKDLFSEETRKVSINYNSSAQSLDMLRRFGLPVNNTRKSTLEEFSNHEIVQKLKEVRELGKLVSTYGDSFLEYINPVTGRIHTDFWQIKDTFRLGSSNPNIQNIPRTNDFRNCVEPRKGYKIISLDYSGQEMRIMSDFSNEEVLIQAINAGKDPHCFVGSMMFGKEIKKTDPEREEAKAINFGKPYGMSAHALSKKLHTTEAIARERLNLHEKTFPALDRWLKNQAYFGLNNGYIVTNPIHKGRRWFPDVVELRNHSENMDWSYRSKLEGSIKRQAMNLSIQGTGAVMMKESLIEVREIIKKYDAFLICTVHDQLDIEVREDQAQALYEEAKKAMEMIGKKYVQKVTMPVEGYISDVWKK